MIGQQLWENVVCTRESCRQSPLQFVCFQEGCKSNLLCECCIRAHQHNDQLMAIRQFQQNIQVLETESICLKALNDYNLNKKKQLQSFEQLLMLFKQNFETLQKQENTEFSTNMDLIKNLQNNIFKINSFSEISAFIEKLSKIMCRISDGSLKLKEIKFFTNDSLDSLKNMIEQSCKTHFPHEIKQPMLLHSKSVANFQQQNEIFKNEKIKIISKTTIIENPIQNVQNPIQNTAIVIQNKSENTAIVKSSFLIQPKAPRFNQFTFIRNDTEVQVNKNGKIAEQQQFQINKYNRVVYLSPNLNLVDETTVAFQYTKKSFSSFATQFGIFVCDIDATEYPKINSQLEGNQIFYLIEEKQQIDPSDILQLRFNKNQLMLEFVFSKGRTEMIRMNEQQNKQFVFCFVLQPGSMITLMD